MSKESWLPGMSPDDRAKEAHDKKAREREWNKRVKWMELSKPYLPHFVQAAANAQRMDPEKFLEDEEIRKFIEENWGRIMEDFQEQKRYFLNDALDLDKFLKLVDDINAIGHEGFHISDFMDQPTLDKIAELRKHESSAA